jgi:hypothetical protein
MCDSPDLPAADASGYDRHDIELRDVADADDARCPDDMDGCLVVSYNAIRRANATYTEGRHVSARLPTECLVLFEGGVIDVAALDATERAWLQAASRERSNEIDFSGTEAGDEVAV